MRSGNMNALNPESWTVICPVLGLGVLCVLIVRCRWSSVWRLAGDEGLRPKRRGRKPKTLIASLDQEGSARVVDATLIEENTRLKAEVAYLKKIRDLRDQGQS